MNPTPNERKTLHEFICASVAACVASIYPRADPQRFVEIVNRTKAPSSVEETLTSDSDGYYTRNGCDCPCCEAAHAKLRAESFARACRSAAAIHCAMSDRRDYHADPQYCKHCDDKDLLAARLLAADTRRLPQEVIRPAATEYHETDTDAR